MFQLNWKIGFKSGKKRWNLGVLAECEIEKSTKNLADTATIILPECEFNKVLNVSQTLKRGYGVAINLGYDDNLKLEFEGYIKEIKAVDGSLKIFCEDALFLFRKGIANKEMKPTSVKKIAQYLIEQIDPSFTLICDYDIPYDKFTIYQATGFDVLAKIQEETGADIFFDMKNKALHIHAAYTWKGGEVDFSLQRNIESSSLEYKTSEDKKVEITIESVGLDGKTISHTEGQAGGEKITKKVGRMSSKAVKILAQNEYKNRMSPGYEGSFDTWLIPYVEPSYTVGIYDDDYPERDGRYYAESVKISFSSNGGKRTITPGIKLSK